MLFMQSKMLVYCTTRYCDISQYIYIHMHTSFLMAVKFYGASATKWITYPLLSSVVGGSIGF